MKNWFKKRKDKAPDGAGTPGAPQQGGPAGGAAPARRGPPGGARPPSDSGSEYTDGDDEPVHDFELAQEDYLVSVALATSANEYQRNAGGGGGGGGFPLAMGAAGALELSKKYWATCRCAREGGRGAEASRGRGLALCGFWSGWESGAALALGLRGSWPQPPTAAARPSSTAPAGCRRAT
jgi:hypothetical protein